MTGAVAPAASRATAPSQGSRTAFLVVALLIFWITLDPLKDLSSGAVLEPTETSDRVNQFVYLSLFCASLGFLAASGWSRIRPLAHPAYGAVLGWFLVGCAFAINPGISLRRLMLSVMVMAIVGVLLTLPRDRAAFERVLGAVALTVVVLCYLVVVAAPARAIHQSDAAMEVNLAGLWRGLYDHKSRTGPMMVVFLFVGLHLWGAQQRVLGGGLALLSAVFLAFTGAKQPQALVPFVLVWSWLAARVERPGRLLVLCLAPLGLYLLFTVGSAIVPQVAAINERLMSDPTFTNRTGIWSFAIAQFLERPVFGYGFLGFWNTQYARYAIETGPEGWAATASHSHDAYLDLALTTGLPGLALAVVALIVVPIRDFARARQVRENRALALLFFRIWLFGAFLGSMETLFFQRDEAFWVAFLIAAFGLRYLACYRVRG